MASNDFLASLLIAFNRYARNYEILRNENIDKKEKKYKYSSYPHNTDQKTELSIAKTEVRKYFKHSENALKNQIFLSGCRCTPFQRKSL